MPRPSPQNGVKKGVLSKAEIHAAAPVLSQREYELLLYNDKTPEQDIEAAKMIRERKSAIRLARQRKLLNYNKKRIWRDTDGDARDSSMSFGDPGVQGCEVQMPTVPTWVDDC